MTYKKEGKNKHDDASDAVTGVIEQFATVKHYTPLRTKVSAL
jgi:hypothetical protein